MGLVLHGDGTPSACGVPDHVSPWPASGARHDRYYVRNNSQTPACVTVTTTTACTGNSAIMVASYVPTFNPFDSSQNWAGDVGIYPSPTQSYSFTLAAGQTGEIVVSETTPSAGCASYTVDVYGADAAPPPPPPPPPLPPPPPPEYDTERPHVRAFMSKGRRGRIARLRYSVWDNSGITRDTIVVFAGRRAIAGGETGWGPARRGVVYAATWRVPRRVLKNVKFCILSEDRSGNESNISCAKVVITK
jgi:hypothetical protein